VTWSPCEQIGEERFADILAVIGEAVRALPDEARAALVDVPWSAIAGLRTVIVHEYFRIQPELIIGILDDELVPLAVALRARRA